MFYLKKKDNCFYRFCFIFVPRFELSNDRVKVLCFCSSFNVIFSVTGRKMFSIFFFEKDILSKGF